MGILRLHPSTVRNPVAPHPDTAIGRWRLRISMALSHVGHPKVLWARHVVRQMLVLLLVPILAVKVNRLVLFLVVRWVVDLQAPPEYLA